MVYQFLPPEAWKVPTIGVRFNLNTVVQRVGMSGSWRWQISNFSRSKTSFICDSSCMESVMRAMEPLTGIGLGVPMRINLSPRVYRALEAGAMILVLVAVSTQLLADIVYTFINPRIRYS